MFSNLHLAAFAIVTNHFGEVLFKLRRDRPVWDLPGGKADPNDFLGGVWHPEITCIREMREETGCEIEIDNCFGYFFTGALAHDILSFSVVFTAHILEGVLSLTEEAAGFGWYNYSSLPKNTFLIHGDIVRQYQKGEVDNYDLRHLIEEQRRVLCI